LEDRPAAERRSPKASSMPEKIAPQRPEVAFFGPFLSYIKKSLVELGLALFRPLFLLTLKKFSQTEFDRIFGGLYWLVLIEFDWWDCLNGFLQYRDW